MSQLKLLRNYWRPSVSCKLIETTQAKTGVVPFLRCRGRCTPLWAVFPPLQVVLSFACSVASLSRCPNHYLPGHLRLREVDLADYPFGRGNPSTWRAGRTPFHDVTSAKPPSGAQRSMTLPRWHTQRTQAQLPQQRINAEWCARTTNAKAQDGCMP